MSNMEEINRKPNNGFVRLLLWFDKHILENIEKYVLSLGLIALSAVVIFTVITRYFLGYSPNWSDELPRFIVIWVTFIGMSYCVRKGEHVVIDVLITKIPSGLRKILSMTILLICFLALMYMTYVSYEFTLKVFATNQRSVTLDISMGYIYMAVPVGCFLSAINFLHIIIKNFKKQEVQSQI